MIFVLLVAPGVPGFDPAMENFVIDRGAEIDLQKTVDPGVKLVIDKLSEFLINGYNEAGESAENAKGEATGEVPVGVVLFVKPGDIK